jgi:hypothetical protein
MTIGTRIDCLGRVWSNTVCQLVSPWLTVGIGGPDRTHNKGETGMSTRETDPNPMTARRDASASPGHRWSAHETKASFKTTELWAAIVGVAALIIIYNASSDLSLDLFRACLLGTVFGAAYILSRGIAKSGSRPERFEQSDAWDGDARRF